jgi:hypothetical protein
VPKIVEEAPYNGATERARRLGLIGLLTEVRAILTGFDLRVKEQQDANGGAAVRRLIDERFRAAVGWAKKQTGDVDWTKCRAVKGVRVCLGIEVQFSARSDLVVVDLIHLRSAIVRGQIDLGLLVVPSDKLGRFLTDRGPKMADAKRHAREARVEDLPLLIWALEHDGPGPALAKQAKRASGTYPTTAE